MNRYTTSYAQPGLGVGMIGMYDSKEMNTEIAVGGTSRCMIRVY